MTACSSNKDEFQCKSNECIKWSYVCDGTAHCSNQADEDCDMCTEDLYLCKDSSRINCTLACSTLGYIPCKNYMDRKICSSVNKKTNSKFFSLKSNKHNYNNLFGSNDLPGSNSFSQNKKLFSNANGKIIFNETLFFLALGLFVLVSISVLLLLVGILYNRMKRNRDHKHSGRIIESSDNGNNDIQNRYATDSRRQIQTSIDDRLSFNSNLSSEFIVDNSNIAIENMQNNNEYINKKYTKSNKYQKKTIKVNTQVESNSTYNSNLNKINPLKSINLNKNSYDFLNDIDCIPIDCSRTSNKTNNNENELNTNDYQVYNEPPPPYKLSKFYPKAMSPSKSKLKTRSENSNAVVNRPLLSNNSKNELDVTADNSHVYENIDEISFNNNDNRQANIDLISSNASTKRGKFRALKKNHHSTSINLSARLAKKSNKHISQTQSSTITSESSPDPLTNNNNSFSYLSTSSCSSTSSSTNANQGMDLVILASNNNTNNDNKPFIKKYKKNNIETSNQQEYI